MTFDRRIDLSLSFDLYLLPSRIVRLDADLASAFIDNEDRRLLGPPNPLDPRIERKKRELAEVLVRVKPGYYEFQFDFEAISDFEEISIEEARLKYRHIEMNDDSDPAAAQFIFFDRYIVIHWYSGTSMEDVDAILYSLSISGDFVVYDPQSSTVFDLRR